VYLDQSFSVEQTAVAINSDEKIIGLLGKINETLLIT
jgi:hypothetical protein